RGSMIILTLFTIGASLLEVVFQSLFRSFSFHRDLEIINIANLREQCHNLVKVIKTFPINACDNVAILNVKFRVDRSRNDLGHLKGEGTVWTFDLNGTCLSKNLRHI